MTIDEAIIHAKEVAECREDMCEECRQEHKQIADWLEELKLLRQQNSELQDVVASLECQLGCVREDAIDDYKAECHKQISKNHEKYGFNQRELVNLDLAEIDMIAEQLKDGGEND